MEKEDIKLVFVYNANSGIINAAKDALIKWVKPSQYECNLCMISYGNFSMKKDWKRFLENLKVNVEILHKDELIEKYSPEIQKFPCAYIINNNKHDDEHLEIFISQEEMNSYSSVDELMDSVESKLSNLPFL